MKNCTEFGQLFRLLAAGVPSQKFLVKTGRTNADPHSTSLRASFGLTAPNRHPSDEDLSLRTSELKGFLGPVRSG